MSPRLSELVKPSRGPAGLVIECGNEATGKMQGKMCRFLKSVCRRSVKSVSKSREVWSRVTVGTGGIGDYLWPFEVHGPINLTVEKCFMIKEKYL